MSRRSRRLLKSLGSKERKRRRDEQRLIDETEKRMIEGPPKNPVEELAELIKESKPKAQMVYMSQNEWDDIVKDPKFTPLLEASSGLDKITVSVTPPLRGVSVSSVILDDENFFTSKE